MNGRTQLAVYETFEELFGRRSTLDELVTTIRSFSQQSVLWVCATIIAGAQLWNRLDAQPDDVHIRLLALFFEGPIYTRLVIGHWSSDPRRVAFHRRQVLLIAKLAILHCSGRGIDARYNARLFGPVLLKASDQFHHNLFPGTPAPRVATRDDYSRVVADTIAVGESGSPHIAHFITRGHLMLTRFTEELRHRDKDFVDIAREYQGVSGLTLPELEAMIFGAHSRFGQQLAQTLYTEPGVLPLREANFSATAFPLEKVRRLLDSVSGSPSILATELRRRDNGPNDFTVFRQFPLVRQYWNMHLTSANSGFLMMDNLFFIEKMLAGPYWNANEAHGEKLRKFWGSVFERYVNELLKQACSAANCTFLPDPRPSEDPNAQLCDGLVVSDDSMVLLEYKSSMFRADTKYTGNYAALAEEIERKLVTNKETGSRKGVWQLAEAVQKLFGPKERVTIPGVDLERIRTVYLYIVTLDSIGGVFGMSPLLETFLDDRLQRSEFAPLEIRPLYCSDIAALETATGHFGVLSLPQVLEQWLTENPSLTAPLSAMHISDRWKENSWLAHEWNSVFKAMVAILFPEKDTEAAMADAIRNLTQSTDPL